MTSTSVHKRWQRSTDEIVVALEAHGLLDPARHDEAADVVDHVHGGGSLQSPGVRRLLAEVAGYIGVAFVVAAVVVFVAPRWLDLSLAVRLGLLAGTAVLLATAAVVLGLTGGGLGSLRSSAEPARRRLASALATAAAVAGAAAVTVALVDWVGEEEAEKGAVIGMGAALTLLVLAAAGYALAPTMLGQLAMLVAVGYGVPLTWESLDTWSASGGGLTYLALGLAWLGLVGTGLWREVLTARVIGSGLLFVGAQVVLDDHPWLAYLLTLLVGVAGFVLYVERRAWPYLVLGVVSLTVVVPEAVLDWTEGSVGNALALLGAGVTLLLTSVTGLRIRREADRRTPPVSG